MTNIAGGIPITNGTYLPTINQGNVIPENLRDLAERFASSFDDPKINNIKTREMVTAFLQRRKTQGELRDAKQFFKRLSILANVYHVKGIEKLFFNAERNDSLSPQVKQKDFEYKDFRGFYNESTAVYLLCQNGYNIEEVSKEISVNGQRHEIDAVIRNNEGKAYYIDIKSNQYSLQHKRILNQINALAEIAKNNTATPVIMFTNILDSRDLASNPSFFPVYGFLKSHDSLEVWSISRKENKVVDITKELVQKGGWRI